MDLDNEALKAMGIKTVGERVKLLVAVKSLRQECYASAATAARARVNVNIKKTDTFIIYKEETKRSKSCFFFVGIEFSYSHNYWWWRGSAIRLPFTQSISYFTC